MPRVRDVRAVFDPDGNYMCLVSDEYAAKALSRGEAGESEEGHLVVIPQAIRPLTPEEKRRIVLAKERSKR